MSDGNSPADAPDLGKMAIRETSTAERLALIKRNLDEILGEDVLDKIVAARPLRIYWGTAITGLPHIAYFLPIMKIRDFVAAGCEVKILLADIHGFLDNLKAPIDKVNLRLECYEKLIRTMLESLGVDLSRVCFVRGSSFQLSKEYTFDLYKISSYTTVHDTMRAGAEVVRQAESPLLSSLIYPNMQALDEEYLDVDAQFGGVDQRKIFVHAAKYLPRLGYRQRIHMMNPMMEGLDLEKMSSSNELSKIDLLDTKDAIQKKIKKCFCEAGNVKTGVLTIFKHIVFRVRSDAVTICGTAYKTYEELEEAYGAGRVHPGDLKACCSEAIDSIVAPVREAVKPAAVLFKEAYGRTL